MRGDCGHWTPKCRSQCFMAQPAVFPLLHPLGLAPQQQFYASDSESVSSQTTCPFPSVLRIHFSLSSRHWLLPEGSPSQLPRRRAVGQPMLVLGLQEEPPGFPARVALSPLVTGITGPAQPRGQLLSDLRSRPPSLLSPEVAALERDHQAPAMDKLPLAVLSIFQS